jgi:hypothetical protein
MTALAVLLRAVLIFHLSLNILLLQTCPAVLPYPMEPMVPVHQRGNSIYAGNYITVILLSDLCNLCQFAIHDHAANF